MYVNSDNYVKVHLFFNRFTDTKRFYHKNK